MPFLLVILAALAVILLGMHRVRAKYVAWKSGKRRAEIVRLRADVEAAFAEISSYYSFSHYITESERLHLAEKYDALKSGVEPLLGSRELDESPDGDVFLRFYAAMNGTPAHKKANNERFVKNQLSACAAYFDTVLPYPLDAQQREAVVSLEDNVLVISSAGSGKTLTMVGKVRYLMDVQHVPAEKILLVTFTRKAAKSLSERLGEEKVKCLTFHSLALEIIGNATGKKPSFTQPDFPVQVYHRLMAESPAFKAAVADYILRARYAMRDAFEYSSRSDYMADRRKYGVQAFFKDMDGQPVFCKSDEESQICDFLGARGIKFRYEAKYEVDTADASHRQYCPDFSIYIEGGNGRTKRVYLEHFAVNEAGHCPPFFSGQEEAEYLQGISWKRGLHRQHGTVLLQTSSAGFHRGDVFQVLARELQEQGAVFGSAVQESLSRELGRQENSMLSMLTAFVFLLKSRGGTVDGIRKHVRRGRDATTFKDIVTPFADAYTRMMEDNGEIDFTDAILMATSLCDGGHRPDFGYILVDEFQDISQDRYRFLQSLRRECPQTKLFCVGDDWQSIYRFAGSDIALFKHFEKFFGYTRKCLMETTYRFGEPAIALSSKFVLANPAQSAKRVRPFGADAVTGLDFLATNGKRGVVEAVKHLSAQIPEGKKVLLLGRYGFDIDVFNNTEISVCKGLGGAYVLCGGRKMDFMTVHQSKGLESDYVILLGCNGGTLGFPSQICESPVLKYVLSEPDEYAFSEERRVFYVAITRAKKHTWVLYDAKNPSPFVKEYAKTPEQEPRPGSEIPEAELCPKCRCGRIRPVKNGVAVNGNPYTVYVCSNEKYGCDYLETKFVNLNAPRRKRK